VLRSDDPRIRDKIKNLKARLTAIQLRLQCPCPSDYGKKQRSEDSDRLFIFWNSARPTQLSARKKARRRRIAERDLRVSTKDRSAARQRLYALKEKERIARARRLRLTRRERTELRFLRLLYPQSPHRDPSSDELHPLLNGPHYPLRDEPCAQDDKWYRPNSKLRPPKDDEIEEEFVEIPKSTISRMRDCRRSKTETSSMSTQLVSGGHTNC